MSFPSDTLKLYFRTLQERSSSSGSAIARLHAGRGSCRHTWWSGSSSLPTSIRLASVVASVSRRELPEGGAEPGVLQIQRRGG